MCDWIKDFNDKFGKDIHLANLKRDKVHGSIKINLKDGEVINFDLTIHKTGDKI